MHSPDWERTRILASIIIQPHVKKKTHPEATFAIAIGLKDKAGKGIIDR